MVLFDPAHSKLQPLFILVPRRSLPDIMEVLAARSDHASPVNPPHGLQRDGIFPLMNLYVPIRERENPTPGMAPAGQAGPFLALELHVIRQFKRAKVQKILVYIYKNKQLWTNGRSKVAPL